MILAPPLSTQVSGIRCQVCVRVCVFPLTRTGIACCKSLVCFLVLMWDCSLTQSEPVRFGWTAVWYWTCCLLGGHMCVCVFNIVVHAVSQVQWHTHSVQFILLSSWFQQSIQSWTSALIISRPAAHTHYKHTSTFMHHFLWLVFLLLEHI